jgi:multiple sugar transport system ATP-binding protein
MKTDFPGEKKNERVSEVAEVLGLDGMLNRKPSALSGGQQQRVSLGRAIVIEPEAFLLDEPFSALDANLRDQMQVEVKRLQRELNTSMIFVTHDQEEAMTLGDRIVVMNDSQIEQIGTPHQIYNDPNNQFVAKFIGSPSVNLIEGMIKESDSKLTFSSDLCDVDLTAEQMNRFDGSAGDSVTLGIRPEYLEFDSETPLFEAEVEVIKPTGSRDAIYLDANGQEIRGLTDQGNVEHTKNAIKISFDIKQAWLFDATGDRAV